MKQSIATEPCEFMDDNKCTGAFGDHTPHDAEPTSQHVHYEDGDIVRQGYICGRCGHVASESFHTDPRLDKAV